MADPNHHAVGRRVEVATRDAEEFGYRRGDRGTVAEVIPPGGPRLVTCYVVAMDRGGDCTFNHLELFEEPGVPPDSRLEDPCTSSRRC